MNARLSTIFVGLAIALLSGCGGGGGGGGGAPAPVPVTSTQSFPFQSADVARIASGSSTNYTISGTCAGTRSDVRSPPIAAIFEGAPALGAGATTTVTYTQCTYGTGFTSTGTLYYDTNYRRLGSSVVGGYYGLDLVPIAIPVSVKVGDTGAIGTRNFYTDSTKSVYIGKSVYSYVVEPDSANTAIINVITKHYNSSSVLSYTMQDRTRIASNGSLTDISIDTQSNTTTDHLIYTAQ